MKQGTNMDCRTIRAYRNWWNKQPMGVKKSSPGKVQKNKPQKMKVSGVNRRELRILRAQLHNAKMEIKDGKIPAFDKTQYDKFIEYFERADINKAVWLDMEVNEIEEGIRELKKIKGWSDECQRSAENIR